jgi:transcriptional regulator with XRE-family HTH domain
MILEIGKKIKALRKANDVTQEKLAEYLSLSYQAVSKWENGTAYPDITLVPAIANFFGVSADELLGMKQSDNNKKLNCYEQQYKECNIKGDTKGRIEISRKVLSEYPRNFQWMLNLAYALTQYDSTQNQIKYSNENNFIQEAISLCEHILEDCTIDEIRQSAIQILCYEYPKVDKRELAIKLAKQMPCIYICSEMLLTQAYEGEEKIKQIQQNILSMTDLISGALKWISLDKDMGKDLTTQQKIMFIETADKLIKTIIYDGNELFYNCRSAWNYRRLAELYCDLDNKNKAMEYLLLAEKSAKAYDEMPQSEQRYTSIFINRCTQNTSDIVKNWEGTEASMLYYRTTESVFDSMRNMQEFSELQKRLKK